MQLTGNIAAIKDSFIHISGVTAGGSMLNITFYNKTGLVWVYTYLPQFKAKKSMI
jgi:hypothetical protein